MKSRDSSGRFTFKPDTVLIKGYPVIYNPNHPRAKANGYVREHIVVAERCLGRPLMDGEVIHHINENKLDSSPKNLALFNSQSDHMRYHWMLRHSEKYGGDPLPLSFFGGQIISEVMSA